ncbi:hypothetical protein QJS04_geneDACA004614 [Acorus gramineus]|uniref:Uncharacterized protein n=1 Tax=Acorus gramineus TaxID=55184 RepID=A0AAV9BWI6_ACOGR|nr:hypothetical protein QJS04_geneDACA004614 [Acorus gramineus]
MEVIGTSNCLETDFFSVEELRNARRRLARADDRSISAKISQSIIPARFNLDIAGKRGVRLSDYILLEN